MADDGKPKRERSADRQGRTSDLEPSSIASKSKRLAFLAASGALGALLIVQFLTLVKPAQARAVSAACRGIRPSIENASLGNLVPSREAPDFTAETADGNEVTLSQLRGKFVIVNFWASWCATCRSEKPTLETFQSRYKEKVEVLALASDNDWAAVFMSLYGFDAVSPDQLPKEAIEHPEPAAQSGAVVTRVDSGRPFFEAGIRPLDVITDVNGVLISSSTDLAAVLRDRPKELTITVQRNSANDQARGTNAIFQVALASQLKILLDPTGDDGNMGMIARRFGVSKVPESFVIDPDGSIRYYFVNRRNWDSDVVTTCLNGLFDS